MPIYTYLCEDCKSEFEVLVSISKKETGWKPVCPECGSQRTRHTYKSVATLNTAERLPRAGSCCSR